MGRRAVIGVFLLLTLATAAQGAHSVVDFASGPTVKGGLAVVYALLKLAIVVAFTVCVTRRSAPRRRTRSVTAYISCAAAMVPAVVLQPDGSTATPVVVGGEFLALAGASWMFASTLALGRCFAVLPEARGLVTNGPYGVVRHPLYLGEFGNFFGLVIASPSSRNLVAALVFSAAQTVRMLMEERELAYQFPAYREYAQRTPRLIPSLRTTEGVEPRAFRSRAARAAGAIRRPRPLRSLASEDGQALVEYAAILVLVSIVAVVSLDTIGGFVSGALSSIAGGL